MMSEEFLQAATSSANQKWETPPSLVAEMATVFPWDMDVCSDRANVCSNFFSPEDDGLSQEWRGLCWMNPPYGREVGNWVHKASFSIVNATVVSLVAARPDTAWWQDHVPYASQVVFIRGRLTFGSDEYWQWLWEQPVINGRPNSLFGKHGKKQSALFPSAFVVWGSGLTDLQRRFLDGYGWNPRR